MIATAMATFAGAWESSGQYRRNAQRYQKVLDTLDSFTIRLDAVRRAAAQGDRESLEKFVAGVHEQLSAEIRQWLEVSATTKDVIARLDDALHKAGTKPPKTDTPSAIAPQQVK